MGEGRIEVEKEGKVFESIDGEERRKERGK